MLIAWHLSTRNNSAIQHPCDFCGVRIGFGELAFVDDGSLVLHAIAVVAAYGNGEGLPVRYMAESVLLAIYNVLQVGTCLLCGSPIESNRVGIYGKTFCCGMFP